MPSSTPAGMVTFSSRSRDTRPWPRQPGHGCRLMRPSPRQLGQGRATVRKPWVKRTWPWPRHVPQTSGWLPASTPEPAAGLAGLEPRNLELGLEALGGLLERDLEVVAEVVPAPRPRAAAVAAARRRRTPRRDPRRSCRSRRRRPRRRPPTHGAEAVVVGALVGVGQDGVRLADLLEALLGLLVAGVAVGVVGAGEVAVGLLQLRVVGVPGDAEDAVVVLGGHARRRRGRRPSRPGPPATVTIAGRSTRPFRR